MDDLRQERVSTNPGLVLLLWRDLGVLLSDNGCQLTFHAVSKPRMAAWRILLTRSFFHLTGMYRQRLCPHSPLFASCVLC